ncbi:hypothetical protein [Methanocorpusculum vombati]|uniref:Uncharacterized protein n=1 Tax=Methanocorpusculum vombati TaxID=3002864 RepID=A0ABT4IKK0_9EURY|nr:hypothetical protein [Methanocorpusculum vombati]MCZ9319584.1 hypothetical protein [Methanocorpusculum sp.]MCZ0862273.1 hypothetical protein [Methanocorpusculum vombati]MDE2519817.1 hypothetical protein [Methanocorpusculum sp.]MDE2534467.1 hypothetical protein [Methanocorpusculum sp.]MDE2547374.1 hypothetical protein [Methanocorpusculum sp.]
MKYLCIECTNSETGEISSVLFNLAHAATIGVRYHTDRNCYVLQAGDISDTEVWILAEGTRDHCIALMNQIFLLIKSPSRHILDIRQS